MISMLSIFVQIHISKGWIFTHSLSSSDGHWSLLLHGNKSGWYSAQESGPSSLRWGIMCENSNSKQLQSCSYHKILSSRLVVPPSIANSRTNVTVIVNVQTTLPCEATGIPKPTISWVKNGQTINTEQSQNMYRSVQVSSHSLLIY